MLENSSENLISRVFRLTVLAGLFIATTAYADPKSSYLRPAIVPAPVDNFVTPARSDLGKMLFFDPRLSGSNWISCTTCHNPAMGWSDGLPTAIGHGMKRLGRATSTILNTAYQSRQMWDGRFRTLEEQALGPIAADAEMNQNLDEAVTELQAIPGYVQLFERAYAGEGITKQTIAKALASFERTVVSGDSPVDRWFKGDETAVSEGAKRGFVLFEAKANCIACHQGFNFTDNGFHNIGLKGTQDVGRFAVLALPSMQGAFKTPTLRDVALTAPYMHNGNYQSLDEVIEHYNRGGDVKESIDPNIKPLQLSKQEVQDLVEFIKNLTSEPSVITVPSLPIK